MLYVRAAFLAGEQKSGRVCAVGVETWGSTIGCTTSRYIPDASGLQHNEVRLVTRCLRMVWSPTNVATSRTGYSHMAYRFKTTFSRRVIVDVSIGQRRGCDSAITVITPRNELALVGSPVPQ